MAYDHLIAEAAMTHDDLERIRLAALGGPAVVHTTTTQDGPQFRVDTPGGHFSNRDILRLIHLVHLLGKRVPPAPARIPDLSCHALE